MTSKRAFNIAQQLQQLKDRDMLLSFCNWIVRVGVIGMLFPLAKYFFI